MIWFEALAGIIDKVLELVVLKEKHKYADKLLQLRSDYRAEYNKPIEVRSDAVLDLLGAELRDLATAVTAAIGKPDA